MGLLEVHAGLQLEVIAPLIGLTPYEQSVINVKCPYCGINSWSIFQDNRTLEEWHYCSQCKASGSVIELAAERLHMTESEALQYLTNKLNIQLLGEDINTYHKNKKIRETFDATWQAARENMKFLKREENQYLKSLGLGKPAAMGWERFTEGPGNLYGILPSNYLGSVLDKHLFSATSKPAVVVPYFRNPTSVGGLSCFQGYKEIFVSGSTGYQTLLQGETGFAGLQLLEKSDSSYLIVTSMLHPALMMHAHHFSASSIPLALISSKFDKKMKEKQWSTLGGRNLVFWEKTPTARMMHQAIMTDACITLLGPGTHRQGVTETIGDRWWHWIKNEPASDLYKKLIRNARPYKRSLMQWGTRASQTEKVNLINEAEQYSTAAYELCCKTLYPRYYSNFGKKVKVPLKCANSYTIIIEKSGKWYDRQGRVQLNGVLRVNYIVVRKGYKEYVGTITQNDKTAEFRVPRRKARLDWLKNFALEHGILLQTEKVAKKTAGPSNFCFFEAACLISPPEVIRGLEHIGWDGSGFQFKNIKICNGDYLQIPRCTLPENAPGPELKQLRFSLKPRYKLDSPEIETMWAIMVAILAQITAPVANLRARQIQIVKPTQVRRMLSLLAQANVKAAPPGKWRHSWPRIAETVCAGKRELNTDFSVALKKETDKLKPGTICVDLKDLRLNYYKIKVRTDSIVASYLKNFSAKDVKPCSNWQTWLDQTKAEFIKQFNFPDNSALHRGLDRVTIS
jgi:hypothetical protein